MNEESLHLIGLTKGEANVYLTLLKIGITSTGPVIAQSTVSRSKVYDVLERLKQKGLVTEVIKENVRYFEATSPERITSYLEEEKKKLEEKIIESKDLARRLNALRSLELEKQEAKIYSGYKGLNTIYNEILTLTTKRDEYLAFGIGKPEFQNKEVASFIKKFHLRREEKGIKARILLQNTVKNEMKTFPNYKNYEYKFTEIEFPTNIAIFKDCVLTIVWEPTPIGFLIKSREIATKYKNYFNQLWKS